MAVYKVLQDIEAEDKLLGPLTLKQFLFAGVAMGFTFAAFMAATKIGIWAVIPFLPFIAVPALLAAPLGRDQPTDIWLAAQIRFYIVKRKRIWDQSGMKELVTITVPKRIEKFYTDGLDQTEVKSRLRALADTIDSRGWAVKNVNDPTFSAPHFALQQDAERLIDPYSLPRAVTENDIHPSDDIMDATNPTFQHFSQMTTENTQNARAAAIAKMQAVIATGEYTPTTAQQTTKDDMWFLNQQESPNAKPDDLMFQDLTIKPQQPAITPPSVPESDLALLETIKENKAKLASANDNHKTIKTPGQIAEEQATAKQQEINKIIEQPQAVTPHKNPAIVKELSITDDVSIGTLGKIAKRRIDKNDEVVVKLR